MNSIARPISRARDTSAPLPHCPWLFVVHGCPPSVIGPSLLLLPVLRTVCPTCHVRTWFSEVASRLSSLGVPFHASLQQLLYCLRRDSCHFRTLKSFSLLTCTYLLLFKGLITGHRRWQLEAESRVSCLSQLGCGMSLLLLPSNHWYRECWHIAREKHFYTRSVADHRNK